ncbi:MAG: type II secretion system secretin GspD [Bdellovibrionales bacterium]
MMTKAMTVIPVILSLSLPPHLVWGQASPPKANLTKAQQEKFARSGPEDITNENFPETIESFDFPNADVADIVKAVSELTGRNFILDPGVRGKVTIIAPSKITVAEAYKMFLSALAIHGYAIVPSDGYFKIKAARQAQRDSIETFSGSYYPNSDQMITKIIHLKYISADEVLKQFRNITTKDGDINAYAPTNSIIISDYGSNVDRLVKIINQLDVPGFEDQIEVVPVRNAKAKDLADLIEKIVNKGQKQGSGNAGGITSGFQGSVSRFSRPGSGASTGNQQGGSYFMAFPDERTNALIVVGNKAGIQRVRRLVNQLDIGLNPSGGGGVYVYYVKHGDAEKIAQVINGVAKDAGADKKAQPGVPNTFLPPSFLNAAPGSESSSGSSQIFGGDVKVTADKNSNSLVVVASKPDYEKVLNLLNRIDIPQDQVYVEAIITEISDNGADDWKVGYYQYDDSGFGKGGFNTFKDSELLSLTSLTGGNGVIIPFAGKKTVQFKQFNAASGTTTQTQIEVPNILGFVNFLKSQNKANILSTPRIMGLNNQEAQIKVTQKIPVGLQNQTTTGGVAQQSLQFEDAGIDLKIKPAISPASDIIRMEITQLVSQPVPAQNVPPQLAQQATIIGKREIKTNIVMRSEDTAALGGLTQDQETEGETKVPVLGDIPVIGWLFKSREKKKNKSNLMVFLTPKIIRNPTDHAAVVGKSIDERTEFIKNFGGRDPYGAKMDEIRKYKVDSSGNVRDPNSNKPAPTPAELEDSSVE